MAKRRTAPPIPALPPQPIVWRTVLLPSGGFATLAVRGNFVEMTDEDLEFVFRLVLKFDFYKALTEKRGGKK